MTTQQYSSLVSYANQCIRHTYVKVDPTLSPHDLVADAYLTIGQFNKEAIIKVIQDQVRAERQRGGAFVPIERADWKDKRLVETSRVCKKCTIEKGFSCFHKTESTYGQFYYSRTCIDCCRESSKLRMRLLRSQIAACPELLETVRAQMRAYNREYINRPGRREMKSIYQKRYWEKLADSAKKERLVRISESYARMKVEDPEKYAVYRLKRKGYDSAGYERRKNKMKSEGMLSIAQQKRLALKSDPIKYAAHLKLERERNSLRLQQMKIENPEKYLEFKRRKAVNDKAHRERAASKSAC